LCLNKTKTAITYNLQIKYITYTILKNLLDGLPSGLYMVSHQNSPPRIPNVPITLANKHCHGELESKQKNARLVFNSEMA
jgi:hypothetical protein